MLVKRSNGSCTISGGFNGESKSECHTFESCTWKVFSSMKCKRRFATLTTIANSSTFIIGGEESSKKRFNTIEKLVNNNNKNNEQYINNNNHNHNNNNGVGDNKNNKNINKNNENNKNYEWVEMEPLIETISRHCAVSVRDKEIFLIGGHIGSDQFSDQTMTLDTT
jgi:hypothetical protein